MRINKIQIGRCRYLIFGSFDFLLLTLNLDVTLLLDTITLIFNKNVTNNLKLLLHQDLFYPNSKSLQHFKNHFRKFKTTALLKTTLLEKNV